MPISANAKGRKPGEHPLETDVKEHPMLFSDAMVRALLNGTKTQTRRIVTVNNSYRQCCPKSWPYDLSRAHADSGLYKMSGVAACEYLHVPFRHPDEGWEQETSERWYPRWEPGDRIWVREPFYIDHIDYLGPLPKEHPSDVDELIYYRADGTCCQQIPECQCGTVGRPKWKPSIHMPRWASRLTREVLSVRAQRLQDISEADCWAEGIEEAINTLDGGALAAMASRTGYCCESPKIAYACLWESINGAGSWDLNPWVWALTFPKPGE